MQGKDIESENKQLSDTIKSPRFLYRYRPVNTRNLEALRTNKLYFSSANYNNDTFDTFLHIDIEKIRDEIMNALQPQNILEARNDKTGGLVL